MSAPSPRRLVCLDTLRGLTVAAMVLVNNPGTWRAIYAPLRHADWHGWTFTDVIFPFFLFIVGVSIVLALAPRLSRGERGPVLVRVLRRSVTIFALGIVLNGFPYFHWATVRIPGVLQRIAVCYCLAAVLFVLTSWRANAVIASTLLLAYWGAMTLVPVPGYGAGNLGKEGNLAAYLDRTLFGPHVWQAARVYDPEGLLSTVPALATVLFGVLAGQWLRSGRRPEILGTGLTVSGIVAVGLGYLWSRWFPVNKALWTSSYAVLMTGLALLALAACYWLIELRGYQRWAAPFIVFGVNALPLYFLSSLTAHLLVVIPVSADGASAKAFVFDHLFAPWATSVNASLAYALSYLLVWWGIMWVLYRREIRLRV